MSAAMFKPQSRAGHGRILKLHCDSGFCEVSNCIAPAETRSIPTITRSGMDDAIKYLSSGVAANFANKPLARGGARNLSDRESHALTTKQVGQIAAAALHASEIGLPFTRLVTVHWEAAGLPLTGMAKATGRYLDLLAKAITRHHHQTAWLWVHENAGGHEKGGHAHVLAHVPPDLVSRLTALQRGWLRRITGQPYRARVIHSKPIGGRLGLESGNPVLHAINLDAALVYVLKGASPEAASQFGLERLEPGGRVIGKRCGTSQNIGSKARAAARGGKT